MSLIHRLDRTLAQRAIQSDLNTGDKKAILQAIDKQQQAIEGHSEIIEALREHTDTEGDLSGVLDAQLNLLEVQSREIQFLEMFIEEI